METDVEIIVFKADVSGALNTTDETSSTRDIPRLRQIFSFQSWLSDNMDKSCVA